MTGKERLLKIYFMIVSYLIDRVNVFAGYKLKITLNISVEQFFDGLSEIENEAMRIPA